MSLRVNDALLASADTAISAECICNSLDMGRFILLLVELIVLNAVILYALSMNGTVYQLT